jgi:hypothetical protein
MLIPCLALFAWYVAMARDVRAAFWVQIFHAMQYLVVTTRVERNLAVREFRENETAVAPQLLFYVGWLLVGTTLILLLPILLEAPVAALLGEAAVATLGPVVLTFVSIHHFFVDGVIWKLRDREVRRLLVEHASAGP